MSQLQHCFIIRSSHGDSRIRMEENGFYKLRNYISEHHKGAKVAVVTDGNLAGLYHDEIKSCLPEADIFVVEPGEKTKTMKVAEILCEDLLEEGFMRNSVLVGLGGGMITDLAGFVASIYMRGMPFIAVPTSLLAMIDASVGGKTAVNLSAKNIIGTFYPAEEILVDVSFLKTLPEREIKTGMAEAIKYAAVLDAGFEKVLMNEKVDYTQILKRGIETKVKVCNKDLEEMGLRKVLNFGHTLGHAVEHLSKYRLSHGEAVSIGMALANKIARKLGKLDQNQAERIEAMLKKYDLPMKLPKNIRLDDMIDMVYRDKKMEGRKVNFILSCGLGKYEMVKLAPEELKKLL